MPSATNRESDKFQLRMPEGMRERIKLAAAKKGRSMNAEIVATLEYFYPEPKGLKEFVPLLEKLIAELKEAEGSEAARIEKMIEEIVAAKHYLEF